MANQISKGETFSDVYPDKTVTSTRLNNHVSNAELLNGAVLDQTVKEVPLGADSLLLGDSIVPSTGAVKRVTVATLLAAYAEDTMGEADLYEITLPVAALTVGMAVRFSSGNANTGPSTLSLTKTGGAVLGVKAIKRRGGQALVANDILAGEIVTVVYNGTYWQLQRDGAGWDYTSGLIALPGSQGAIAPLVHGCGGVPTRLRVVLVQTGAVAVAGYAQNDEIEIGSVAPYESPSTFWLPLGTTAVDATLITFAESKNNYVGIAAKTGAWTDITASMANFKLKFYASL